MKKPFSVGDRVRVYGGPGMCVCTGRIDSVKEDGLWVEIENSNGKQIAVYPQQCRRLIKRPRKRVWIEREAFGKDGLYAIGNNRMKPVVSLVEMPNWTEFREVRKPK